MKFLLWSLISCGQDPSFSTKDTGEEANDSMVNDDLQDITDSFTAEELKAKQEQQCLENEIPLQECFANFHLVVMEETQGPAGSVDILWIVDNSGSMSEEQNYLGTNFNSFISELDQSDIDFQLAVTSTDVCQDQVPADLTQRRCPVNAGGNGNHHRGSFLGQAGQKVLSGATPDLISRFNSYVNVGTNGSGFEHGFTAAQLALEKVVSGANEDLLRDNSYLAVIVVSDEQDDGIGLSQNDAYSGINYWNSNQTRYRYTEDNLISYLAGLRGEGQFSISTIAPTVNPATGLPCTSPHSQPAEVGTQYIAGAEKTGGIIQSICSTNWDDALSQIGKDLNAQMTQLYLAQAPAVSSIKVFVNDAVFTEWTYIAQGQLVKFNAGHIPAAGSVVRLEYLAAH